MLEHDAHVTAATPAAPAAEQIRPLGEAMAAFVAAGIGSLALGVLVLLHAADAYSAPALHAGAGGISGRTTFAVIAWLVSWAVLHRRWRVRDNGWRTAEAVTLALVVLSLLATLPLLWEVF